MDLITKRIPLREALLPDWAMKAAKDHGAEGEEVHVVRKGLVPEDTKFKEKERASVDYITTKSIDRDGEIILPGGAVLDDYLKHPVVLFGHDYRQLPVGRSLWVKADEKGLVSKTKYANTDKAKEIWAYRKDGFPLAKSIGFLPLEQTEQKDFKDFDFKAAGLDPESAGAAKRIYTKWLMLEYSDVPVPSNPDALQLAISKGLCTEEQARSMGLLELVEDTEMEAELAKEMDKVNDVAGIKAGKTVTDFNVEEPLSEEMKKIAADKEAIESAGKSREEVAEDAEKKETDGKTEEVDDGADAGGAEAKEETKEEMNISNVGIDGEGVNTDMPLSDIAKEWLIADGVITKPETTDAYHRIPVSTGHDEHKIRTITISADEGISALYCVDCKKNITYLFSVEKWSMEEARAWVKEHSKKFSQLDVLEKDGKLLSYWPDWSIHPIDSLTKSKEQFDGIETSIDNKHKQITDTAIMEGTLRWNKSLSKTFDVVNMELQPSSALDEILRQFLDVPIKHIYQTSRVVRGAEVANTLSAMSIVIPGGDYELKDLRNFNDSGRECPPVYEELPLSIDEKEEFLVEGTWFYVDPETEQNFAMRMGPVWGGIAVQTYVAKEHKAVTKDFWGGIRKYADENHIMKNKAFALSGEFLPQPDDLWSDLFVDSKAKSALLSVQGAVTNGKNRGLMLVGPPGTGKTLAGRVLQNELEGEVTFIWVSARDFYYGGFDYAFNLARKLTPTMLFMEDVDTWIRDSTVDLLKVEMDGLVKNKGIVTVLTSNEPGQIPDALIDRPGRFDDVVLLDVPDESTIKAMLEHWLPAQLDTKATENNKALTTISVSMVGLSGAHVRELVRFAESLVTEGEWGDDAVEVFEALGLALEKVHAQRLLIAELRGEKPTTDGVDKTDVRITGLGKGENEPEKLLEIKDPEPVLDLTEPEPEVYEIKHFVDTRDEIVDSTSSSPFELVEKEGRVLSTKNRKTISEAVTAMGDATTALNTLMEATEIAPKEEPKETPQVMVTEAPTVEDKKEPDNEVSMKKEELMALLTTVATTAAHAVDKARSEVDVAQIVEDRINTHRGKALRHPRV